MAGFPQYLLDVSTLIALGVRQHQFHDRVAAWVKSRQFSSLATCPITELGFVRVLAQSPPYGLDVEKARNLLFQLRNAPGFPLVFLADDQDVSGLPGWVKSGKQTTDGHLVQLAKAHGAVLATLDAGIPGGFVIP